MPILAQVYSSTEVVHVISIQGENLSYFNMVVKVSVSFSANYFSKAQNI